MGRGYKVHSVVFGPDWTEVVYTDERFQSPDVNDLHTRFIKTKVFSDQVEEIVEEIEQLLDDAHAHRRNPPPPGDHDD